MKQYDFQKAKALIDNANRLQSASLGMHEDWFWTAETVFENGEYVTELNEDTTIGGINGSSWATPTLELVYEDGETEMVEVSLGESDRTTPPPHFSLGIMSGPAQDNLPPLKK